MLRAAREAETLTSACHIAATSTPAFSVSELSPNGPAEAPTRVRSRVRDQHSPHLRCRRELIKRFPFGFPVPVFGAKTLWRLNGRSGAEIMGVPPPFVSGALADAGQLVIDVGCRVLGQELDREPPSRPGRASRYRPSSGGPTTQLQESAHWHAELEALDVSFSEGRSGIRLQRWVGSAISRL